MGDTYDIPRPRRGVAPAPAQPKFNLFPEKPLEAPVAQTTGAGYLGTVAIPSLRAEALDAPPAPRAEKPSLQSNLLQYGIGTPEPGPTGYGGPTAQDTPDEFAGAAGELARRQREYASQQQAMMAAGGGGGYRPEMVKIVPELEQAYKAAEGGYANVQSKLEQFQQDPARAQLMSEHSAQLKQQATDEESRMKRLQGLGTEQKQLSDEMAGKVEGFRVDPNRLFGQGAQRAAGTFVLGLQNIFSNLGDAMQGKAGTNAVLSFVKDRIAQDISLQEQDYQRMLQGYNVRRNGLMDAVQQVGNERQGAEAVAKQQGLVYADQITRMMQGVEDSRVLNTLTQARAEILKGIGGIKQGVESQNVHARNQAAAQASSARAAAVRQRMSMMPGGVSEKEHDRISKALDKAEEKGLFARVSGLKSLREVVQKYPNAASEARGILGSFYSAVREEKDQNTLERLLANAAQSNMSEGARQYMMAYNSFIGPRIRALAGANVTPGERFLYDPERYSSPQAVDLMLANENKRVRDEAAALEKSSGLNPGSDARLFLRSQLYDIYGTAPKEAPPLREVTREGKPIK